MALGAKPGDVLAVIVRQGMGMVLMGILAGVIAAAVFTRMASELLIGVSATDPLIFCGAAVFLAAVALAAACIPAIRATHIDPNIALRCQ